MDAFHRDGYTVIRGAISPTSVESFTVQLNEELCLNCGTGTTDRTLDSVNLSEPNTWPSGGSRRVVECAPLGVGSHWTDLKQSKVLSEALNALLGKNCWEIPLNTADSCIRHWYCPVSFPEHSNLNHIDSKYSSQHKAKNAVHKVKKRKNSTQSIHTCTNCGSIFPSRNKLFKHLPCDEAVTTISNGNRYKKSKNLNDSKNIDTKKYSIENTQKQNIENTQKKNPNLRRIILESWKDELNRISKFKTSPTQHWQPVSRRRFRGKGWHIDIGPGFPVDELRRLCSPIQGMVVLVLLSDWTIGSGGTAMIPGSHKWVSKQLYKSESLSPPGISHSDLNNWCVQYVRKLVDDGKLWIENNNNNNNNINNINNNNNERFIVRQICGKAGDIVLMHPWLIHSGTTNMTNVPRLMANGMIQIKNSVFSREGCRLLQKNFEEEDTMGIEICSDKRKKSIVSPRSSKVNKKQKKGSSETNFTVETKCSTVIRPLRLPLPIILPKVSVIIPIYNACPWLHECLSSILSQSYFHEYQGSIEVCMYDDASTDDSAKVILEWKSKFINAGFECVCNGHGPYWVDKTNIPGGAGNAKNMAVLNSTGTFLCFIDADDYMRPDRIVKQLALVQGRDDVLIGSGFTRNPNDATLHYSNWCNSLTKKQLFLEQYREITIIQPTWFLSRRQFDRVGGYETQSPDSNSPFPSDLVFFHSHLDKNGCLDRVNEPLVTYRYLANSVSWRIPRKVLLQKRLRALERRVLSKKGWGKFTIWGAGRDGKNFINELLPKYRSQVSAFCDVDYKKIKRGYHNHKPRPAGSPPISIPVIHFTEAKAPIIICVAKGRTGGQLESNIKSLGLIEGCDYWHFS